MPGGVRTEVAVNFGSWNRWNSWRKINTGSKQDFENALHSVSSGQGKPRIYGNCDENDNFEGIYCTCETGCVQAFHSLKYL